jgi:hypothetical protein
MALIRVRYAPGVVGETKRVVHLVNMPGFADAVQAQETEEVSALCGETMRIDQVDVINGMAGAPCFLCLQKTPSDDGVPEQRQIATNGYQRMGDELTFRTSGAIF